MKRVYIFETSADSLRKKAESSCQRELTSNIVRIFCQWIVAMLRTRML